MTSVMALKDDLPPRRLPAIPVEIQRLIFEAAATHHPIFARRKLVFVARHVQEWLVSVYSLYY